MAITLRMVLLGIFIFLVAMPVQAAPFWPFKTGSWVELDKQDNVGHQWVVTVLTFEQVTRDGRQYYYVTESYYDPYQGDLLREMYIRSTDTEVYNWNGPGQGETMGFKLGEPGDSWTYEGVGGTNKKEIVTIEEITIPYGGTFQAIQYKHTIKDSDLYELVWLIPGLGLVKKEEHWASDPARIPVNSALARAGMDPFFKFTPGERFIYNSSDQPGNNWHMTLKALGTTAYDGYLNLLQTDYVSKGSGQEDRYPRSTAKQVFEFNGAVESLQLQAADKGTKWTLADGTGAEIIDIAQVTVPLGTFVAYVHRYHNSGCPDGPYWYMYAVPGVGVVKFEDYSIDPARAPIVHLLTQKLTSGSMAPLLNLLLFD